MNATAIEIGADILDSRGIPSPRHGSGISNAQQHGRIVQVNRLEQAYLRRRYRQEYALGRAEWADNVGMTYDDDPNSPRSRAYDIGRTDGEDAARDNLTPAEQEIADTPEIYDEWQRLADAVNLRVEYARLGVEALS